MEHPNAITEAEKIVSQHPALHGQRKYWTGVIASAMLDFNTKCNDYVKENFNETIINTHLKNKAA